MPQSKKPRKAKKDEEKEKAHRMELLFAPSDESSSAEEDGDVESGMFVEKEDIQIIYNALSESLPNFFNRRLSRFSLR
jgi:hypothetical protein